MRGIEARSLRVARFIAPTMLAPSSVIHRSFSKQRKEESWKWTARRTRTKLHPPTRNHCVTNTPFKVWVVIPKTICVACFQALFPTEIDFRHPREFSDAICHVLKDSLKTDFKANCLLGPNSRFERKARDEALHAVFLSFVDRLRGFFSPPTIKRWPRQPTPKSRSNRQTIQSFGGPPLSSGWWENLLLE